MVQTRQSTRNKTRHTLSAEELECARILLSLKEKVPRHGYNLRPSTGISYHGMDGEPELFKQTRYNLRIY